MSIFLTNTCVLYHVTVRAMLSKDVNFGVQIWSDWPQMGQICDFLRSASVHFGSVTSLILWLTFATRVLEGLRISGNLKSVIYTLYIHITHNI